MKAVIALLGIFFIICPILGVRVKRQTVLCNTPDNYIGVCVLLPNCPSLINLYGQSGGSYEVIQYLKGVQRNCGTRSIRGEPLVCCKDAYRGAQKWSPWTFPPETQTQPVQPIRPTRPTRPSPPIRATTTTTTEEPTTTTTTTTTPRPITSKAPTVSERQADKNSCFGPDAKPGTCTALKQCTVLVNRLRERQGDKEYAHFLRLSNEICAQPPPIVCCPTESLSTSSESTNSPDETRGLSETNDDNEVIRLPRASAKECGISNNTLKRIVGGEVSKPGAWPWVTLLGYDDPLAESPFKCGGALITKRHVLTAAHCIRRNLRFVRLGEYDLDREDDSQHVDINISKVAQHSSYSRQDGHSDVAVLTLERNVEFTNEIQPICLPIDSPLRSRSFANYNPFVAGWGKTQENGNSSRILLEIQIPVYENKICQNLYAAQNKWISYKQFDNAIICAGVLSGGKDTCQGDSGGPLMLPEQVDGQFVYNAIGVVSYGIGCGRPQIPGVYANVSNFLDWIEARVLES